MNIRRKLFSKMEDQDYIEGHENRKKSVKHAKGVGTVAGSVIGAGIGHSIGKGFGKKGAIAGAAIGAVGGGTLGRLTGKAIKKSTEDDANKKIARYMKASEHDKKYLREKEEKERDRAIQERQARAMENTAWHTSRWYSKKEFSKTELNICREQLKSYSIFSRFFPKKNEVPNYLGLPVKISGKINQENLGKEIWENEMKEWEYSPLNSKYKKTDFQKFLKNLDIEKVPKKDWLGDDEELTVCLKDDFYLGWWNIYLDKNGKISNISFND